jgi:hypothetical protein
LNERALLDGDFAGKDHKVPVQGLARRQREVLPDDQAIMRRPVIRVGGAGRHNQQGCQQQPIRCLLHDSRSLRRLKATPHQ